MSLLVPVNRRSCTEARSRSPVSMVAPAPALSPEEIDRRIGEQIRKRRVALGLTQEQLAAALDVSYQQLQKYESGANRIAAARLFLLALRLDVPLSFFFDGLAEAGRAASIMAPVSARRSRSPAASRGSATMSCAARWPRWPRWWPSGRAETAPQCAGARPSAARRSGRHSSRTGSICRPRRSNTLSPWIATSA
jgi:transcriptional regulator with XRE-family HTH domain